MQQPPGDISVLTGFTDGITSLFIDICSQTQLLMFVLQRKISNVVLEKDGEDQLNRSCEK